MAIEHIYHIIRQKATNVFSPRLRTEIEKEMICGSVFFQFLCAGVGPNGDFMNNDKLQAWGCLESQ